MSESYVGEIRMFAGNYAPQGWALCEGQLLNISEYDALFALLGTTYGGDGQTNFGLPDFRGRVPIHPNSSMVAGEKGGTETVTLTLAQLPSHSHPAMASTASGDLSSPENAVWSASTLQNYSDGGGVTPVPMSGQSLSYTGSGQPHDNMMPSLSISFIISLFGVFPTQS